MRQWYRLRQLLRTLLRSRAVERDLDDELQDWVETLAARHAEKGLSPSDARRAALADLGGIAARKEEARSLRNGSQLDSVRGDLRQGWRALRGTPAFTAAAVITFGLGVGANAAIFSVVKSVLIEPLPYRDAERLMLVWADLTNLGYPHAPLSGPELVEFIEGTSSFDALGGVWATNATLAGDGDPEQLRIATVTDRFFETLGVTPALGKAIGPDDFGKPVVPVLLSHALWVRRFGADPGAVGKTITLNDRPATIAGVMGAGFKILMPADGGVPDDLQAWIPGGPNLRAQPRGQQYLRVVARLKKGASHEQGASEVAAVGDEMIQSGRSHAPGARFYAVGMQDDVVRAIRPALIWMFAGVGILLLSACINVAGLLVVRAAGRTHETLVRIAIGASYARLARQFLVEGLLLSALGVITGVAVARLALAALVALAPPSLARLTNADLDAGVFLFILAIALVWGLVFSVIPLSGVFRLRSASVLQSSRGTGGDARPSVRRVIVVAQLAMGMVLLVGALLLAETFQRLLRLDPGFSADRVITFRVSLPFSRYRSRDSQNAFHRELTQRLRALPGVDRVGGISHLPYDNLPNWGTPYLADGEVDASRAGLADTRTVSPGFFETVGARLVRGRFFDEHDDTLAEVPVVIDELMAARVFGDGDPVGRTFRSDLSGSGQMLPLRVIGVVGHLRHRSLTEYGREQLFVLSRRFLRNPVAYAVRVSGGVDAVALRAVVAGLDKNLPVYDMRRLDDYVQTARSANLFTLTLSAAFAGVALVLACVGVYGVMAYAVDQRRREFGIRLALGASPRTLILTVLRSGALLTAAGLLFGVIGAALAARFLRGQLFEVAPSDPASYLIAATLLGVMALAASWLPARRATSASPLDVLRVE